MVIGLILHEETARMLYKVKSILQENKINHVSNETAVKEALEFYLSKKHKGGK